MDQIVQILCGAKSVCAIVCVHVDYKFIQMFDLRLLEILHGINPVIFMKRNIKDWKKQLTVSHDDQEKRQKDSDYHDRELNHA